MNPTRWHEIERLYHAALARPVEERAAYLLGSCDDESLRREVESLLQSAGPAEGIFANPAIVLAAQLTGDRPVTALTGQHIGVYLVRERLGVGGMGEVYRARDTRLGRDVALKIIAPALAATAERQARFEREARVLAALNHPHIGAIYGFEEGSLSRDGAAGPCALVLEFVNGPTLAERLSGGPLPRATALAIAIQICDALEAAHDKGIVHRDLKPANIKITPQGVVKVLDFGLAKAMSSDRRVPDRSQSPTTIVKGTTEGLLLGTAAYMSPEQARGHPVDAPTDIWAFGCVLYEMLTGRAAFARETQSDTIAAILEREPDWTALRSTPIAIQRLMRQCFEKNPVSRPQTMAGVRQVIRQALDRETTHSFWSNRTAWKIAAEPLH